MASYKALLNKIDELSDANKNIFCGKQKNLSEVLFYDDEENGTDMNIFANNNKDTLFTVNSQLIQQIVDGNADNYKKLSQYVKSYIVLDDYNMGKKYNTIVDCILSVLSYFNYDGVSMFYKKLLREYDIYNLHKKFKYINHKINRNELRNLIIDRDEKHKHFKQFLADYLNINLVVFNNDTINIYSQEFKYEVYRPTIIIYEYDNKYQYLINKETETKLFLSEDEVNHRLLKVYLNKEVLKYSETKPKVEISLNNILTKELQKEEPKKENKLIEITEEDKPYTLPELKKMKVADLRKLCQDKSLPVRDGKKYLKKQDLIDSLMK